MGTVQFFDARVAGFTPLVDAMRGRSTAIGEEELANTEVRVHHSGDAGGLQLFELRLAPGTKGATHAHVEDEIIVVVEGELRFGAHVCTEGSSVMVPGGTLYGFEAGPDGCRFLNFRPRVDTTYITKDEFLASRDVS
jgi:uncharacterized cupin superfamily protein